MDRKGYHDDQHDHLDHGNSSQTTRPPTRGDEDDSSSGSSGTIIGSVAGAGSIALGASAALSAPSMTGTGAAIVGSVVSRVVSRPSGSEGERIPLIKLRESGTLQKVEVVNPSASLKDLIRD